MNNYQNDFMEARLLKLKQIESFVSMYRSKNSDTTMPADPVLAMDYLLSFHKRFCKQNSNVNDIKDNVEEKRRKMHCDY